MSFFNEMKASFDRGYSKAKAKEAEKWRAISVAAAACVDKCEEQSKAAAARAEVYEESARLATKKYRAKHDYWNLS